MTSWPSAPLRPRRRVADRLAGHRGRVLVQLAELLQTLGETAVPPAACRSAATKRPPGLRSHRQRRGLAIRSKSSMSSVDAHLARDGQQVQDGVGRAAGGRDRERSRSPATPGDQVARPQAAAQHVHHQLAGREGDLGLRGVLGGDQARADRADAHHLEGHRHRVGGVLAAARAGARAGRGLDVVEVLVGDLAGGVRADGLEDILDRDVLALVVAGRDRAAVEHHAGDVQPRERHHGAGDRLVAARTGDQARRRGGRA